MRQTRLTIRYVPIAAALLLAACGSDSSSSDTTTAATAASATAASATEAPASTAAPATTATAGTTVEVADTSLGQVLVDDTGMTLYLFTKDTPGTSVCQGDCLVTWPPLAGTGTPTAGTGVDAAKLGTITRSDGSSQVTYAGWPLYHFAADAAPGDVMGQGVGGVWFAVLPDGTPAA